MVESWETCDEQLELAAKASPELCYQTQPLTPGSDEHGDRQVSVSSDSRHRNNELHRITTEAQLPQRNYYQCLYHTLYN